jgi:DNA-binding CsgD family transcriptional regulator
MMMTRSVVVAHGEAMVAEGLAAALGRYPVIVPVGIATTVADGERRGERADVLVLHDRLPGAADAAIRLRRKGVHVILLGSGDDGLTRVLLTTRDPVASLASAIVPREVASQKAPALTARQREVLFLVARGMPGKLVARHLGISPKTVEHHMARIRQKLGAPNGTAAVTMEMSRPGRIDGWARPST